MSELQQECVERCVLIDDLGRLSGNDAGKREEVVRRLLQDSCMRAWEAKGLPVKRLASFRAAASVVEEMERLESLGEAELVRERTERGIPLEDGLGLVELLAPLRDLAIWEALPLAELRREGGEEVVGAKGVEEHLRRELVERLLLERCASKYEAWGVPARELGSLRSCAQLAQRFSQLEALRPESLLAEVRRLGLPLSRNPDPEAQRHILQDVATWELLPLPNLEALCEKNGIAVPSPSKCPGSELRRRLLDQLLLAVSAEEYAAIGVPVQRLGSLQGAAKVAGHWERMDFMAYFDLKKEASTLGVPDAALGADRQELLTRLKSVVLWGEMSLEELQKECRSHGVNAIARQDQQHELIRRIALSLWSAPPPMPRGGYGQQRAGPQQFHRAPVHGLVAGYFRTLELPPNSSLEDVKKAYRRLALKFHPDKNPEESQDSTSTAFKQVAEAYAGLCDHLQVKVR